MAKEESTIQEGQLTLFLTTWNMHGQETPQSILSKWIPQQKFDIYAIGTQECLRSIEKSVILTSKEQWEEKLANYLGEDYTMLRSHKLGAVHLAVFVRIKHLPLYSHILHSFFSFLKIFINSLSLVRSNEVATGIGNVLNNKGGVGISFMLGRTSFLFITAHFTSGDANIQARNSDFNRINSTMELYSKFNASAEVVNERFDQVFWFGDFNYRISFSGRRAIAEELIEKGLYEILLAHDQLRKEMKSGNVFKGFEEEDITFKPTYKLEHFTDIYDTSIKARMPSYTDRILYKTTTGGKTQIRKYDSCHSLQYSDHRPVFAEIVLGYEFYVQNTLEIRNDNNSGSVSTEICNLV